LINPRGSWGSCAAKLGLCNNNSASRKMRLQDKDPGRKMRLQDQDPGRKMLLQDKDSCCPMRSEKKGAARQMHLQEKWPSGLDTLGGQIMLQCRRWKKI